MTREREGSAGGRVAGSEAAAFSLLATCRVAAADAFAADGDSFAGGGQDEIDLDSWQRFCGQKRPAFQSTASGRK